jgi:hypothetical protein
MARPTTHACSSPRWWSRESDPGFILAVIDPDVRGSTPNRRAMAVSGRSQVRWVGEREYLDGRWREPRDRWRPHLSNPLVCAGEIKLAIERARIEG